MVTVQTIYRLQLVIVVLTLIGWLVLLGGKLVQSL